MMNKFKKYLNNNNSNNNNNNNNNNNKSLIVYVNHALLGFYLRHYV